MKKSILFVLALVAITIISCSKDKNIDDLELNGNETYTAVSISFPNSITTKAADPNASVNETKVTTIGVYIVDKTTGFMHSKIFTNSEFEELAALNIYKLKSAIKTTSGNKIIAVVLNPNDDLKNMIDVKKGTIFGKSEIDKTTTYFTSATDGLVMTSTEVLESNLPVGQKSDAALAAPLAIDVQRNTAKIAVKQKNASITVIGGSISNAEFALVSEAKKSYLIQQGGNTYADVRTPGWSYNPITVDNPYFTKLATPGSWISVDASTTANKDLSNYYTLENVNKDHKEGNTTAAIIKLVYTPTNGTAVTNYNIASGAKTGGNISVGSSFYVKKSDNTFWSKAAYEQAIVTGSPYSLLPTDFSLEYENGVSYYRIWIQDANGNLGILRNNFYILNITKITGPGLPYVPGTDPDDPDEPKDPDAEIEEDTMISFEITVLPWSVESSDHDI